jgi:NAD(P)H-hydrate epimerase
LFLGHYILQLDKVYKSCFILPILSLKVSSQKEDRLKEMITIQQMRELEKYALSKNITVSELMENAGKQVYQTIMDRYDLTGKRIILFCGTGNNGGDGLVAARYFCEQGYSVVVLLFGHKDNLSEEALENYELVRKRVNIITITDKKDLSKFKVQSHLKLLFVDAMLGIGTKGAVYEPVLSGIDLFNSLSGIKVAVDVPSGLNADTGESLGKKCECDLIITLHDAKSGLQNLMDKTVVVDIGLPRR